ncbi:MAG: hypothetical protein Q4D38_04640 [Planctomycetia bacterium]|nr:hypothetical protein [Planctomycetia bacterium]
MFCVQTFPLALRLICGVGFFLGFLPILYAQNDFFPEKISIVTNQARAKVAFWLIREDGAREAVYLERGETRAVWNPSVSFALFQHGNETARRPLRPDAIHVFSDQPDGLLELYALGPDYPVELNNIPPRKVSKDENKPSENKPLVIRVLVYADENIPLARDLWEKRVEERIAHVSSILEKTCFVRLEVEEFRSWRPTPSATLREAMKDFEKNAPLERSRLIIGFISTKNFSKEMSELGVARAPFYPRILLREEAPQITEVERVETMLHELGHFFGAVHTSDDNSVMRTVLKDRRGRIAGSAISFDPFNALAMNLWVRQYRRFVQSKTHSIDEDIRIQLLASYALVRQLASEQAAAGIQVLPNPNVEFLEKILSNAPSEEARAPVVSTPVPAIEPATPAPAATRENENEKESKKKSSETTGAPPASYDPEDPLGIGRSASAPEKRDESLEDVEQGESTSRPSAEPVAEAEIIEAPPSPELVRLREIRAELWGDGWESERVSSYALPARTTQYVLVSTLITYLEEGETLSGDLLGERLTRAAAEAALNVGGDKDSKTAEGRVARQAFLLAMGVLGEPSGKIFSAPIYGKRFRQLETEEIRTIRKKFVSNVSIFKRSDWSQHFWLSAALSAHLSATVVESVGVEKERRDDLPGGSGFDITDLNADLSGVAFAQLILMDFVSLKDVVERFEYSRVVPSRISVPKNLKHPSNNEEIQALVDLLRKNIVEFQKNF